MLLVAVLWACTRQKMRKRVFVALYYATPIAVEFQLRTKYWTLFAIVYIIRLMSRALYATQSYHNKSFSTPAQRVLTTTGPRTTPKDQKLPRLSIEQLKTYSSSGKIRKAIKGYLVLKTILQN